MIYALWWHLVRTICRHHVASNPNHIPTHMSTVAVYIQLMRHSAHNIGQSQNKLYTRGMVMKGGQTNASSVLPWCISISTSDNKNMLDLIIYWIGLKENPNRFFAIIIIFTPGPFIFFQNHFSIQLCRIRIKALCPMMANLWTYWIVNANKQHGARMRNLIKSMEYKSILHIKNIYQIYYTE